MKRHTILLIQSLLASEPEAIVVIGGESYGRSVPQLPPRDPRLTDEVRKDWIEVNAECFRDWGTAIESAEEEWEHMEDADLLEQLELDGLTCAQCGGMLGLITHCKTLGCHGCVNEFCSAECLEIHERTHPDHTPTAASLPVEPPDNWADDGGPVHDKEKDDDDQS